MPGLEIQDWSVEEPFVASQRTTLPTHSVNMLLQPDILIQVDMYLYSTLLSFNGLFF